MTKAELQKEIEELEESKEDLEEEFNEDQYDEMLDDCYPEIDIVGVKYSASHALKEIDPVRYDCGFSDWQSEEITNKEEGIDEEIEEKQAEIEALEEEYGEYKESTENPLTFEEWEQTKETLRRI